jgi:sodium-dependent phosphate transporter
VAGTIRYGIVQLSAFTNPGSQMLGMTTALVVSACWLMFCTYNKWPVSTTYSIVSALTGMGVALAGPDAPNWVSTARVDGWV